VLCHPVAVAALTRASFGLRAATGGVRYICAGLAGQVAAVVNVRYFV
jgi:hypothetical protein